MKEIVDPVFNVCDHLCEDEGLWVATVQAEDEADRLKQFLDAGAKLFLLHPTSGPRVKDPRLDDKLKQIFQGLRWDACLCLETEKHRGIEGAKIKKKKQKNNNIQHGSKCTNKVNLINNFK